MRTNGLILNNRAALRQGSPAVLHKELTTLGGSLAAHASNGDNPVRGFADADVGTKQAPLEQKCNTFHMLAEHPSLCSLGNVSSLNASNSLARDVAAPNHVTWSHVPRPRKTRFLRLRTRADERIVPRPCRPSGEYGSANRIRPNPADRALTQKTPKANAGHIKSGRQR